MENAAQAVEPEMGEIIENPGDGPIYRPARNERQLTVRAVLVGCLLGAAISAMNIRFGLKTGWSIGGSLISAILAYAIFSAFLRKKAPFTPLETNIAQTAGSAAGSMTSAAGLLSAIPAMNLLGYELAYWELTLWAASVAWLGIFYAVPLRRQMVLVEKLRFPSGTATASTIQAMFSSGDDAIRKARVLVRWAGAAAAFTLAAYSWGALSHPTEGTWGLMLGLVAAMTAQLAGERKLTTILGVGSLALGALWYMSPSVVDAATLVGSYSISLYFAPMMFGAGILIGWKVGVSLLIGALLAWGVIAPAVETLGWVADPEATMSYSDGARGWVLWPGVAIMVADALTSLALSWKTIVATFTGKKGGDGEAPLEDPAEAIPNSWVALGLAFASLLTIVSAKMLFEIPIWMTILAVAMSSVLAMIAVRSTGETDINPIGGMGKVTQLVYGGLAPGQVSTNLMSAAITSAGASQAGDMMHDLKAGYLLGASPRKQLVAQLIGVGVGIISCVPIYILFQNRYEIGGAEYPAPAAFAWKSMAEVLAQGLDALPTHALPAVVAGLVFGALVPILRKAFGWTWLPSGLAMGIAFIVPAYYSINMFLGALLYKAWERGNKAAAGALGFAVASGLIAGDGIMGVLIPVTELILQSVGLMAA